MENNENQHSSEYQEHTEMTAAEVPSGEGNVPEQKRDLGSAGAGGTVDAAGQADSENSSQPDNTDPAGAWQTSPGEKPEQPYLQNPYSQQPQQPYGQTPYGQQSQQPYDQNPYGQQYQQPYGQNPYGQQYQQPYGQNPYGQQYRPPYGQNPYGQAPSPCGDSQPRPRNTYATVSLISGIFGILSLCCFAFPGAILLGVGAIAFAVLSKKGQPMRGTAIAGVILGILSVLLGVGEFAYVMAFSRMLEDPETARMFHEIYEQFEQQMGQ